VRAVNQLDGLYAALFAARQPVFEHVALCFRTACMESTLAQGGWTALMHAAYNGFADNVRLLLDSGADKNAKNQVRPSLCAMFCF
jgi:hypothetical protein